MLNILVAISIVPDSISEIHFMEDQKSINFSKIQWNINPIDELMLSKAIEIKKTHGAKVQVLTIGETHTEPLLRKALAMGSDEGIRVNFTPKDSLSTAQEIAKIAQGQNFDLIFLGNKSQDFRSGAVPSLVAEILNIPFVNSCIYLEINNKESIFTTETLSSKDTLKANFPLVVAGQKGILPEKDLIIPNMRNMMMARTKSLDIREASSYPIPNFSFEKSPKREKIKFINPENLEELIEILHQEKKLI